MNRNYPIKNNQPIAMQDDGPYGTSRAKSADGKYTASDQAQEQTQFQGKFRKKNNNQSQEDQNNQALNNDIYEPLFEDVMNNTFVKALRKLHGDKHIMFDKSDTHLDKILGVDYTISPIVKGNGFIAFDEFGYRAIDLKVVEESLGDDAYYENPNIVLNLFKTFDKEDKKEHISNKDDKFASNSLRIMAGPEFHPGSFANGKHINNCYSYMYIKSPHTRQEILEGADPEIQEVKGVTILKKQLDAYVRDRVFRSDFVKNVIGFYTRNRTKTAHQLLLGVFDICKAYGVDTSYKANNLFFSRDYKSIKVNVPIAGEESSGLKATIHFRRKSDGVMEVRMYLPLSILNNKRAFHGAVTKWSSQNIEPKYRVKEPVPPKNRNQRNQDDITTNSNYRNKYNY